MSYFDNRYKKHFDKVLLIFEYLYLNTNRINQSFFDLKSLILDCGYTPEYGKNRTIEQFKSILLQLHDLNFITITFDLDSEKKINLNKRYICSLNFDLKNNYFELHDYEKARILTYVPPFGVNIDCNKMLILFCYLKSRMYHRTNVIDRRSEVCYPSYNTISIDTGISSGIIHKYLVALDDMNLLHYRNAGKYYLVSDSKKKLIESSNTYVLHQQDWEIELDNAIDYLKSSYDRIRVFVNKNYKNNDRKINGLYGRLKYLVENNKASNKQKQRYIELVELKAQYSKDEITKFHNEALLNVANKDLQDNNYKLLSDIYYDLGKMDSYEKYKSIEIKFSFVK